MKFGVSYFGNRMRRYVYQDLQEMVENGFSYVVHTYSENDWTYFEQSMKEIVQDSHDLGLSVILDPWGVGGVFGGEAFSQMTHNDPDISQVFNNGESAPIACFNNPVFLTQIKEWIESAAKIGADSILWDEPHWFIPSWFKIRKDYSDLWVCHCTHCQKKFRDETGKNLPREISDEAMDFRENSLVNFLRFVTEITHEKGMKNVVCLISSEAYSSGIHDWEKVVSLPKLDVLASDPYWIAHKQPMDDYVNQYSKKVKELCKRYGKEEQLWVQAFRVPRGREKEIEKACQLMIGSGINDIAFWGFRACEHMSKLRPDDPASVWSKVLDVVGKYHNEY